jgi:hypothetical protein
MHNIIGHLNTTPLAPLWTDGDGTDMLLYRVETNWRGSLSNARDQNL